MATISLFFWTLDMGFLTDQSFGFFMKIAIFHLSSWLLFSIFNPAQAGMNLFNGNFHQGWLDYQTTSADSAFFIQRTYNSASPYEGLFGKGWCSNVETRLEITAAQLRVVECGGGRVVTYTPAPSRKGVKNWRSSFREGDRIELRQGQYWRHHQDSGIEVFSKQGQLKQFHFGIQGSWSLKYSAKGLLQSITGAKGQALTIRRTPTSMTIFTPQGPMEYVFTDGWLVQSKNTLKETYTYAYNSPNKRMSQFSDQKGPLVTIEYHPRSHRTQKITNRSGCSESYDYQLASQSSTATTWNVVTTSECIGIKSQKTQNFVLAANGSPISSTEVKGRAKTSLIYWQNTLKVAKKLTPFREINYQYDPQGRMTVAQSPTALIKYSYVGDSVNPVNLKMTYKDYWGQKREGTAKYSYHPSGQPQRIEDFSGTKINVTYDKLERPRKIAVQTVNSKPKTINIVFNQKGELMDLQSAKGSAASRFEMDPLRILKNALSPVFNPEWVESI